MVLDIFDYQQGGLLWYDGHHSIMMFLLLYYHYQGNVFFHRFTARIFLPFKDLLRYPLVKEGVFAPCWQPLCLTYRVVKLQ